MLQSRVFLLFYIVFFISTLEVLGQGLKKCAAVDEYCQMHSDCCSNSCLTYLYRCTRNYNGVYPYTFFGERYPATGTLEDVMAFTFSNFRTAEEMRRHQVAHQHQTHQPHQPQPQRPYEGIDGDMNYLNDEGRETEATTAPETANSSQQVNINNDTQIEAKASDGTTQCKVIGLKCFKDNECCSQRCHGYLHQCVT